MIKQLIKSVKDFIDGKRHYSLQLLPTDLDYTSTVGEQLTEAKLIDHASGTSDMIRIKLTDHNRFVLRWISATRQMKNIGEYCTTHRISPYMLLNEIFSPKSYYRKWNAPELYESFNKWFMNLGGCKRGIRVDYVEEEQFIVVQVCNPYGNRYMVAIDAQPLLESSIETADKLSRSLMHSEKVGLVTINNDKSYCSLEDIALRIKRLIELGAEVIDLGKNDITTLASSDGTMIINKHYTP